MYPAINQEKLFNKIEFHAHIEQEEKMKKTKNLEEPHTKSNIVVHHPYKDGGR